MYYNDDKDPKYIRELENLARPDRKEDLGPDQRWWLW
jgi:hypothetical protein